MLSAWCSGWQISRCDVSAVRTSQCLLGVQLSVHEERGDKLTQTVIHGVQTDRCESDWIQSARSRTTHLCTEDAIVKCEHPLQEGAAMPLVATGLLQHEAKLSVLNFSVKKCAAHEGAVANKDELLFVSGVRCGSGVSVGVRLKSSRSEFR